MPWPVMVQALTPGVDLPTAAAQLAPWCKQHPSGYWSIPAYVACQAPGGLKPEKNNFHKGIFKVLAAHQAREVSLGAAPDSFESLDLGQGASAPSALDPKGTSEVDPSLDSTLDPPPDSSLDPLSNESLVPSSQVPSPTRGSGGAKAPLSSEDVSGLESVKSKLLLFGFLEIDPKPWDLDAVRAQAKQVGWEAVQKMVMAYCVLNRPEGCLKDLVGSFPGLLASVCEHPKDARHWWTSALDSYPKGLKQKHWRCGVKGCGHHQLHGTPFLERHDCQHELRTGKAWLTLQADPSQTEEVTAWEECEDCGHQRRPQPQDMLQGLPQGVRS